jgi:hypothetical protein
MFEADVVDALRRMRFNGFVRGINPKTGKEEDIYVVSACADKSSFVEIDLSRVDSVECLLGLCNTPSLKLHLLKPVTLSESLRVHGDDLTHGTSTAAPIASSPPRASGSARPERLAPNTKLLPDESPRARALVQEKGPYWEYLLTEELIRSKLSAMRREALPYQSKQSSADNEFDNNHFLDYFNATLDRVSSEIDRLTACINEQMPASLGPSGQPGDAKLINSMVEELIRHVQAVQRIEGDMCSTNPPQLLLPLRDAFHGLTGSLIDEVMYLPDNLSRIVNEARQGTLSGPVRLELAIKLSSFFSRVSAVTHALRS